MINTTTLSIAEDFIDVLELARDRLAHRDDARDSLSMKKGNLGYAQGLQVKRLGSDAA